MLHSLSLSNVTGLSETAIANKAKKQLKTIIRHANLMRQC